MLVSFDILYAVHNKFGHEVLKAQNTSKSNVDS